MAAQTALLIAVQLYSVEHDSPREPATSIARSPAELPERRLDAPRANMCL